MRSCKERGEENEIKKPFVLLRLSYCLVVKFCMPLLPDCISQCVLQADQPIVGVHVRHMSNDYMNICAVFMLNSEY